MQTRAERHTGMHAGRAPLTSLLHPRFFTLHLLVSTSPLMLSCMKMLADTLSHRSLHRMGGKGGAGCFLVPVTLGMQERSSRDCQPNLRYHYGDYATPGPNTTACVSRRPCSPAVLAEKPHSHLVLSTCGTSEALYMACQMPSATRQGAQLEQAPFYPALTSPQQHHVLAHQRAVGRLEGVVHGLDGGRLGQRASGEQRADIQMRQHSEHFCCNGRRARASSRPTCRLLTDVVPAHWRVRLMSPQSTALPCMRQMHSPNRNATTKCQPLIRGSRHGTRPHQLFKPL